MQGFTKDYPQAVVGASVDVLINGTKVASTSGTEIDFTAPSGIKEFKLSFDEVSTNGTSLWLLQLGDSGGVESTGYNGAGVTNTTYNNSSAGVAIGGDAAASYSRNGFIHGVLIDEATNLWAISGVLGHSESGRVISTGYTKALSGELTTIRLTTAGGSNTFDNGAINVQYENPDPVVAETVYLEGKVVQTVKTQDGEVATGTTTIPYDDTIPQNTEGNEFMTASITPQNANNLLRIDVKVMLSHSAGSDRANHAVALFQDSTADALAVSWIRDPDNSAISVWHMTLTHWMTAGTTDSTTFKVRAGTDSTGTCTFNGRGGSRKYGGALASSITITEYAA